LLRSEFSSNSSRRPAQQVRLALRVLICFLFVISPLYSTIVEAAVDTHANAMAHVTMEAKSAQGQITHKHGLQTEKAQMDCCVELDLCEHGDCSSTCAVQSLELTRPFSVKMTKATIEAWEPTHLPQLVGHRPLLDPPIP
jgi:hypothetical protein